MARTPDSPRFQAVLGKLLRPLLWVGFVLGDLVAVALIVRTTREWDDPGHELVVTGVVFVLALPLLVALARYGGSASVQETAQRRTVRRGFYAMAALFGALALWQAAASGVSNAGVAVGSIICFVVARLNTAKR